MSWQVSLAPEAAKDLRRLPAERAAQVVEAIRALAGSGRGDVKRLKASRGEEWRLRVGEYRVRLALRKESQTLVILRVLPRGSAYKE